MTEAELAKVHGKRVSYNVTVVPLSIAGKPQKLDDSEQEQKDTRWHLEDYVYSHRRLTQEVGMFLLQPPEVRQAYRNFAQDVLWRRNDEADLNRLRYELDELEWKEGHKSVVFVQADAMDFLTENVGTPGRASAEQTPAKGPRTSPGNALLLSNFAAASLAYGARKRPLLPKLIGGATLLGWLSVGVLCRSVCLAHNALTRMELKFADSMVHAEDTTKRIEDYNAELEAEVSKNVERKLAKERRARAEEVAAWNARIGSIVDNIEESGLAIIKSSSQGSITETLTPKRILDISAVTADFANRAIGKFDDHIKSNESSVKRFSEFALRRPFSVEMISPVLNERKYFNRHFNRSKATKSLVTATMVMPKALTNEWNLTEAWISGGLHDDREWESVRRAMLVLIFPLDDVDDGIEIFSEDGESLLPHIGVGGILVLGSEPLFDDGRSISRGVATYEDLQKLHEQPSASQQALEEKEVVESAAATFKEEGLVVLKGASAGLSLDEAEHAIEKIEEFSNRALERYMYYYYTAAKRNKTDDEVLGHFYDNPRAQKKSSQRCHRDDPFAGLEGRLVNVSMSIGDVLFTDSRLLHRPTVNTLSTPVPTLELFFAKSDAALERITMLGTSWLVPRKEYQRAVAEQEELERTTEEVDPIPDVSDAQSAEDPSAVDGFEVDGYDAYISRQEEALGQVYDAAKHIMSEKLVEERQKHFEHLAELQLMKAEQTGEQERIRLSDDRIKAMTDYIDQVMRSEPSDHHRSALFC
ncbi:hypothetical protein Pmar_PMAR015467 [Perkinsus marinus ATCC 50983]|uniref:Uncharacterized protein n=1 Tax=Perkinsus marinus (strain ATCC 50983 / TXsc) TaxID=423536 RepID=C5L898_PERM5|nr:hypothetical protein Pmar_PMAR015467 [Perkinsus marinus ATCC 50983]EER07054.1 hypothetical protein Pmar_PMAR015467 [Perkinsus marinus ATCC 50983]|eukprot:XP_002775238.1 hypothetical protein Pmar_PMAR015467 [Perkinsus marinus ATCC 50983]